MFEKKKKINYLGKFLCENTVSGGELFRFFFFPSFLCSFFSLFVHKKLHLTRFLKVGHERLRFIMSSFFSLSVPACQRRLHYLYFFPPFFLFPFFANPPFAQVVVRHTRGPFLPVCAVFSFFFSSFSATVF